MFHSASALVRLFDEAIAVTSLLRRSAAHALNVFLRQWILAWEGLLRQGHDGATCTGNKRFWTTSLFKMYFEDPVDFCHLFLSSDSQVQPEPDCCTVCAEANLVDI